jgi:hypothetical protein
MDRQGGRLFGMRMYIDDRVKSETTGSERSAMRLKPKQAGAAIKEMEQEHILVGRRKWNGQGYIMTQGREYA